MVSEVLNIVTRSLWISGTATAISMCWSIPIAYYLARHRAESVVAISEGLVGIPTVLLGLLLYFLLSRSGPLGFLNLLYTPYAIIVGESILVTPLIISTSYRVLRYSIEVFEELALSLGASERQAAILAMKEALPGILSSFAMAFSRAVGELGIALMVGGNIEGYTRVMTTAIALEVARGSFELATMLGVVLVSITVSIAIAIRIVKRYSWV